MNLHTNSKSDYISRTPSRQTGRLDGTLRHDNRYIPRDSINRFQTNSIIPNGLGEYNKLYTGAVTRNFD